VDYVPFTIGFAEYDKLHDAFVGKWRNKREHLAYYQQREWDDMLDVGSRVTPNGSVNVRRTDIVDEQGREIVCQTWETPGGSISEKLYKKGWDDAYRTDKPLHLSDDFRTSRYIEFPFKEEKDLAALPYLFPVDNPVDIEGIKESCRENKKLAEEFGVMTLAGIDPGLDWLMWLFPAEEAVFYAVDSPDFIESLLGYINKSKHKRLEVLLDQGVDAVMRRGWYESGDFWSPKLFRRFAKPALEKEIKMAHEAGVPYIYIMDTGLKQILPELASLDFDCIYGADPVLGNIGLTEQRAALPGKSIWGGVSTYHYAADSPDLVKAPQPLRRRTRTPALLWILPG